MIYILLLALPAPVPQAQVSGASFDFGLRDNRSALRSGRDEIYVKNEDEAQVIGTK